MFQLLSGRMLHALVATSSLMSPGQVTAMRLGLTSGVSLSFASCKEIGRNLLGGCPCWDQDKVFRWQL
jgi:hypothetical protein